MCVSSTAHQTFLRTSNELLTPPISLRATIQQYPKALAGGSQGERRKKERDGGREEAEGA